MPSCLPETHSEVTVSDLPHGLHPIVREWFIQHKRDQESRRRQRAKNRNPHPLFSPEPLHDLTKRDRYRFEATSSIFKAVEAAGGTVTEAPLDGKVSFLVGGEKVECAIVEKMFKPIKSGDGTWTAYTEHHQTGLQPTGNLRITITTYIGRKRPEWVETGDTKVPALLNEIASAIVAAGQAIAQDRREREQAERERREKEAQNAELKRLQDIDDQRWARFSASADAWDQHSRLLAFVVAIKNRIASEGDVKVAGHPLAEWIQWAEKRLATIDPFAAGVTGLFDAVSAPVNNKEHTRTNSVHIANW